MASADRSSDVVLALTSPLPLRAATGVTLVHDATLHAHHWTFSSTWPASTASLHTMARHVARARLDVRRDVRRLNPRRPFRHYIARTSPDLARTQSDVDRQQTEILRPSVNVGPARLDVAHTSLAVEHQLTASGCI
ncbi:hypothetical protein BKA62DRAFT_779663 [Auriculariales sp. MPI-PUGE-AT-0066]|nr:hypothetical protein BKA62DRAFT_779663 [Auriculariales sp. MPI-PUGE-AT-0066]